MVRVKRRIRFSFTIRNAPNICISNDFSEQTKWQKRCIIASCKRTFEQIGTSGCWHLVVTFHLTRTQFTVRKRKHGLLCIHAQRNIYKYRNNIIARVLWMAHQLGYRLTIDSSTPRNQLLEEVNWLPVLQENFEYLCRWLDFWKEEKNMLRI